jgi:hypothetical protein
MTLELRRGQAGRPTQQFRHLATSARCCLLRHRHHQELCRSQDRELVITGRLRLYCGPLTSPQVFPPKGMLAFSRERALVRGPRRPPAALLGGLFRGGRIDLPKIDEELTEWLAKEGLPAQKKVLMPRTLDADR